jgi:hypothetical protein
MEFVVATITFDTLKFVEKLKAGVFRRNRLKLRQKLGDCIF